MLALWLTQGNSSPSHGGGFAFTCHLSLVTVFNFPREVLLVEIERRCADPACNARAFVGLTKDEARAYEGFECPRCERWNEDTLSERDIPEWWEELRVTGLEGLRGAGDEGGEPEEAEGVVRRLSDGWRELRARGRRRGRGRLCRVN